MYPYDNEYYCQTGATHGSFEENFIIRVVIVTWSIIKPSRTCCPDN